MVFLLQRKKKQTWGVARWGSAFSPRQLMTGWKEMASSCTRGGSGHQEEFPHVRGW